MEAFLQEELPRYAPGYIYRLCVCSFNERCSGRYEIRETGLLIRL